jgi:hypothetical protein
MTATATAAWVCPADGTPVAAELFDMWCSACETDVLAVEAARPAPIGWGHYKAICRYFTSRGVVNRAERMRRLSELAGRPVGDYWELAAAEAPGVVAALREWAVGNALSHRARNGRCAGRSRVPGRQAHVLQGRPVRVPLPYVGHCGGGGLRRIPLQRRAGLSRGGPLATVTPLRTRQPLERRTPVKPVSGKRGREIRVRRAVIKALYPERPLCTFPWCLDWADDVHEPRFRSRLGSATDPANFRPLCREHHDWTHDHPDEAAGIGLAVHSWEPSGEQSGGDAA